MKNIFRVRISSKGQVTIPKTVRNFLGVRANDFIEFVIDKEKNMVTIRNSPQTVEHSILLKEFLNSDKEIVFIDINKYRDLLGNLNGNIKIIE
jgi:AbrB family looped-hinge helix DNA binding protein